MWTKKKIKTLVAGITCAALVATSAITFAAWSQETDSKGTSIQVSEASYLAMANIAVTGEFTPGTPMYVPIELTNSGSDATVKLAASKLTFGSYATPATVDFVTTNDGTGTVATNVSLTKDTAKTVYAKITLDEPGDAAGVTQLSKASGTLTVTATKDTTPAA